MASVSSDQYEPLERLRSIPWDFASANTEYLTHGIHPYPAKFIPQIPRALIEELSSPGIRFATFFAVVEQRCLKHSN